MPTIVAARAASVAARRVGGIVGMFDDGCHCWVAETLDFEKTVWRQKSPLVVDSHGRTCLLGKLQPWHLLIYRWWWMG